MIGDLLCQKVVVVRSLDCIQLQVIEQPVARAGPVNGVQPNPKVVATLALAPSETIKLINDLMVAIRYP
jgi:hypothetical protein